MMDNPPRETLYGWDDGKICFHGPDGDEHCVSDNPALLARLRTFCEEYYSPPRSKSGNFAFIDGQNLNLGIQRLGWKLDFRKFKVYLAEKYKVKTAFLFLGFLPEHQNLYRKPSGGRIYPYFQARVESPRWAYQGQLRRGTGAAGPVEMDRYIKAVIVTSDGDFHCLTDFLYAKNKLEAVLSPGRDHCSKLLRKAAKEKMMYMDTLRGKLEYAGK